VALSIHAYVHLQHSHMWIAFTGALGRIFINPAHHQAQLWNWLFGTLYVPQKAREPLRFGVPGHTDAHTVKAEMLRPFVEAARHLKSMLGHRDEPLVPVVERKPG